MAKRRTRKRNGKTVATLRSQNPSRKNIPTTEYQADLIDAGWKALHV